MNRYRNGRDSRYEDRGRDRGPRKNHDIRAQEVRLVDEDENNIGVVSIQEAMSRATEAGLDLVEVAPQAKPPVVKIIDYSKYLYEQNKKLKKNKVASKTKELKEFRFTPVIDDHDTNFRVKRAKTYLDKGHNVRITMFRKGRQSREQAIAKFEEILTNFEGYSSIEPEPKNEGRRTYITLKPHGTEK